MKKTAIIFLMVVLGTSIKAQKTAITDDGKKVILNDDFTWKYQDTVLNPFKEVSDVQVLPDSSYECSYFKNEVDEFSGIEKIILKEEVFLTYTSEEMKKYYRKKDYFTCSAYLAKIEGSKVIYWRFKILTKSAYKYYGSLSTQSKITLKFENGETLDLQIGVFDSGDTNYDYDYTTYSTYTMINDEAVNLLKSSPTSKARVYWSQGYQDYEVTNKKLFINSINCIK